MYGHNPFSYTVPLFGAKPSGYGEVQFSDLPRLETWTKTYLGHRMPLFLSEFCVPTAADRRSTSISRRPRSRPSGSRTRS